MSLDSIRQLALSALRVSARGVPSLGACAGATRRLLTLSMAMTVAGAAFAAPPASRESTKPTRSDAPRIAPPSGAPSAAPSVPRMDPKPREVAPSKPIAPPRTVDRPAVRPSVEPRPARPEPTRPEPRTPVVKSPPSKAPEVSPREVDPREVKPRETKPRETNPRETESVKPIDRPAPRKPLTEPKRPSQDIDREDDREVAPRPRPVRDDAPITQPTNPPVKRPDPIVVRTPRETNDVGTETARPKPPVVQTRDLGKADRGHFTADSVHGVPVSLHRDRDGDARVNRPIVIDNRTYNRYVNNVARCNGWSFGARWSDCGPCDAWQPYHCRDGARVSFGFGSGFSFGFYYGTSCAPLCASWCNPWWEGYACSWSCAPYGWSCAPWYRPVAWNPCRPWWQSWYACGPCPIPTWTPCYAYSVYTPVVYTQTIYVPPAPQPPSLPNPDAMWAFLADGYDRDAEDGFILLESAYPADARWTIGQAFARAFRSDTMRAADLVRSSFANDPTAVLRCPSDPKLMSRLEALERSLMPSATAARPSIDALIVLAAAQAARGELREAYLNATTAEAEGDRSRGTTAFVSWLRAELRRVP